MPGRKHTTIEAGGKLYNLRASFLALAQFEKDVGSITILEGQNPKLIYGFAGLVMVCKNAYGGDPITYAQAADICEQFVDEKGTKAIGEKVRGILDVGGWIPKGEPDPNVQESTEQSEK